MQIERRFYFPSNTIAPVTPAFSTGWSVITNVGRGMAVTTKRNSPYSSQTTPSNSVIASILNYQFISQPLTNQIFSGSMLLSGQTMGSESNGAMNAVPAIAIRVVSNDGNTDRGVLFETLWPTLTTANEYTTTITNRFHPPPTGISGIIDVQNGDRLVFEFGTRQTAASNNRTVTQRIGDANIVDLPVDQTALIEQTPWIEFNQDIFLQDPTRVINWEDSGVV